MEKKQISVIKTCCCPPSPRAWWTRDPSGQCLGNRGLSVCPLVLLLCSLPDVLCQHLPPLLWVPGGVSSEVLLPLLFSGHS